MATLKQRLEKLEGLSPNKIESLGLPFTKVDMDIVSTYWQKNGCEFVMLPDPNMTAKQVQYLALLLSAIDKI